jgi:small conductance mechanosensitive channel
VEVREEDIFAAQRRLNRAVKLALDEGGIEIPFPQVVVHQAK